MEDDETNFSDKIVLVSGGTVVWGTQSVSRFSKKARE
jgi:hypothetical protein